MSEEPVGYPVGLVGESNYQDAIQRAAPGDPVQVLHETGNPYDKKALVAKTANGDKLGYIARDCWLRDAIHYEGQSCSAVVFAINTAPGGSGVVIDVTRAKGPIGQCSFEGGER